MSQPAHALRMPPRPAIAMPRWLKSPALIPLGVGSIALIAMVAFDLGPPLYFNDDWSMAWGYRQLVVHHQVHVFPVQSALALVQTFTSAVLTLGHTDQRLLRLTILPFVILAALSSYRMARQLGAGPFWSGVAGVSLLGAPLYLTSATSYLTDTPYVGLMMAATAAGLSWVRKGTDRWQCVLWSALCPWQRQLGVVLPLAVTIGLFARSRKRALTRSDWIWLVILWLAVCAAAILPVVTGIAPPTQANRVSNMVHVSLARAVLPLVYFPAMTGLLLLPFAAATLFARKPAPATISPSRWDRILALVLLILLAAGIGDCAFVVVHGGVGFYPGNVFTPRGFTPILLGDKVSPFPLPLFTLIEAATVATFTVFFLLRRGLFGWRAYNIDQLFLLLVSGSQLLPLVLLQTPLFDRYYLPVVAPLIPLLALRAASSTRSQLAAGWAIGCLLFGVGLYIVGQQDYEAWQVARNTAARMAFREAPADRVDAGYEANAVAVEVPAYEASGAILGGLARAAFDPDYAATGPAHPLIRLQFAALGDARPGADYRSLVTSGRIVLTRP